MKYYAVTGRIPGDDEDTLLCVGQCRDAEHARGRFRILMTETFIPKTEDAKALIEEHGTSVFVNSIVSSDSPIRGGS